MINVLMCTVQISSALLVIRKSVSSNVHTSLRIEYAMRYTCESGDSERALQRPHRLLVIKHTQARILAIVWLLLTIY